jgi:hypothetical protein
MIIFWLRFSWKEIPAFTTLKIAMEAMAIEFDDHGHGDFP